MSTLYLVGVPIGNYDDITFRAVEVLNNIEVIAAEDTRKANRLLSHIKVSLEDKKIISHGSHNEKNSVQGLLSLLVSGQSVAFISDAGMPGISDPGYMLARAVRKAGIEVKIIPGVSAVTTAVVASNLPCDRFIFTGFLPRTIGEKRKKLEKLKNYGETLVVYESPRRVVKTLGVLLEVLGNRPACVGRELTKTHEEVVTSDLQSLFNNFSTRSEVLGEIVIIVAGSKGEKTPSVDIEKQIKIMLKAGKTVRTIRDELSPIFAGSGSELYKLITNIKQL